mmetsp:Transcript_90371/g.184274  ORF Transcript_90371/g.184274 Transcript_90371/m.184274 type:complete len:377 (+) Transcript_90371:997-2127(+)
MYTGICRFMVFSLSRCSRCQTTTVVVGFLHPVGFVVRGCPGFGYHGTRSSVCHSIPHAEVPGLVFSGDRWHYVVKGIVEVVRTNTKSGAVGPLDIHVALVRSLGTGGIIHGFLENGQSGLSQQGGAIGTAVAFGFRTRTNLVEIDVGGNGDSARNSFQYRHPVFGCGQRDIQQFVQAAWSHHRWIDEFWSIGCGDDKDAPSAFQPVHFREELVHDPFADAPTAAVAPALRTKTVELVEKDHAGRRSPGTFEHQPNRALTLTDILVQQFRALDADEIGATLVGNGLCQKRLSTTRRTVKHNTGGQGDAERLELFWVADWFQHAQCQFLANRSECTDIVPGHTGHRGKALSFARWLNLWHGFQEVLHSDVQRFHFFRR